MKKLLMTSALMFAVATLMAPISAQANLVTNPGFETGDLTNWSSGGPGLAEVSTSFEVVHSGTYGVYFEPYASAPGYNVNITQNIYLSGPGTYEFGGYLRFFTFNPSGNWDQGQISIGLDGVYATLGSTPGDLGTFIDATNFIDGWLMSENMIYFSGLYNYAGSGGFALLNISLQNAGADWVSTGLGVDDVFVNPVPEPSTMLLLGSGLVGLVGYGRRRFKK